MPTMIQIISKKRQQSSKTSPKHLQTNANQTLKFKQIPKQTPNAAVGVFLELAWDFKVGLELFWKLFGDVSELCWTVYVGLELL
jgi:hypothetical protein